MLGMYAESIGNYRVSDAVLNEMELNSERAQDVVSSKVIPALEQAPENLLAVVYAGISAFNQAIDTVEHIHRKAPHADIIVVTCDCDVPEKKRSLGPLIVRGIIKEVVVTPICGGQEDMGLIVSSLIEAWPAA